MSFWDTAGRIGFGLATGGLSELPGAVDKYVTHGREAAGQAAQAQRSALDKAMARLQAGSAQQYQNRMNDLNATMAFYGPAQRYLQSIYGGSATGPLPLASGPPGMGSPPPGFPKPQGPPSVMGFGQPGRGQW